jgi:hypothetical protein
MAPFIGQVNNMTERNRIFAALAAEVSFAVLPLLVVVMVFVHVGHGTHMLGSPEWSFGAAILFGQALVKFVSSLARAGSAATGPVALIVALIVVFGLVPSLFVLDWSLQSYEQGTNLRHSLQAAQVILFCTGAGTYMVLGAVSEAWLSRSKEAGNSNVL